MIKKLILVLLAAAVFAACGCGKKAQSPVTEVENPQEKPAAKVTATPTPPPPPAPKPIATRSKNGMIVTKSGLQYKDKKVGSGSEAKNGQTATVHYKGWLDDGTVFDTSKKPGAGPFSFTIGGGNVIKGWDEGVRGMKVGGVRNLVIPPALGYGDQDMGSIPPNSTLHFDVELLKIGS